MHGGRHRHPTVRPNPTDHRRPVNRPDEAPTRDPRVLVPPGTPPRRPNASLRSTLTSIPYRRGTRTHWHPAPRRPGRRSSGDRCRCRCRIPCTSTFHRTGHPCTGPSRRRRHPCTGPSRRRRCRRRRASSRTHRPWTGTSRPPIRHGRPASRRTRHPGTGPSAHPATGRTTRPPPAGAENQREYEEPWPAVYSRHPEATIPGTTRLRTEKSRRRPTLPGGYPPSTIGAGGLNCRVRNGNGCLSAAIATGNCALSRARGRCRGTVRARHDRRAVTPERSIASTSKFPSPRPISTGQLNALPHVHFRPINVVVWPRALPG